MPCDQSSISSQLIGPASALVGVLIGLLFSAWTAKTEREYQRKVLLRSKYEELAHALSESVSDIQLLLTADTNRELFLRARPALAQKIDTLAQLYFRELRGFSTDYLDSIVALQCSLAENYDNRSSLSVAEQGAKSDQVKISQEKVIDIQGCNHHQSTEYILVEKEWQRRLLREQHKLNRFIVILAAIITSVSGLLGVYLGAFLVNEKPSAIQAEGQQRTEQHTQSKDPSTAPIQEHRGAPTGADN